MKLTKKQWLVGASLAVVLAGGGAGFAVYHQHQVQADKMAHEAQENYKALLKEAKTATEKAEAFKAEADVKVAQDAIKKLEEKDKDAFIVRVEKVDRTWALVNKADQAVVKAEKNKNDATIKTAQTALDQLKEKMSQTQKATLQKRLDKVKATVKEKQDREKAQAAEKAKVKTVQATQATSQTETSASNGTAPTASYEEYAPAASAQATPSAPAPAYTGGNGGGAYVPVQPQANTGNPAYNSGAGANANPNVSLEEGNKWIEDANNGKNAGCANGGL